MLSVESGAERSEALIIDDSIPPTSPSCIPSPEICVICLDRISDKAACLPCHHDQFDFPCLGTWLQQKQVCPLCKQKVAVVRYVGSGIDSRIFHLPEDNLPRRSNQQIPQRSVYRRPRNYYHNESNHKDTALALRRDVYRNQLYSLHIGANPISGYRNITPPMFSSDPLLVSRARAFLRRELRVFDFLNPGSEAFGSTSRRPSNPEYLLEYIIAILKQIDLKGSTGQAEELLKDFLGRQNARLFLHELEAWLRSPFERLEEWDQNVQYAGMSQPDARGHSSHDGDHQPSRRTREPD